MTIEYEAYAIRYATVVRKARDNFLSSPSGDPHDADMPLDFFIWLARSEDRRVLVDTGFSAAAASDRGRTYLCEPHVALEKMGVPPETIDDVVLTHFHYDHAGNTDAYPNATFHFQDAEMRYATSRYMTHPSLNHFFDARDVQRIVGHTFDNRTRYHDGDATLAEGITLHRIGGHTDGLQVVRVNTARGPIVLASDAAHYYRNKLERNPFPAIHSVGDMLEGWRKIDALAGSSDRIVPGHDPAVRELYPDLGIEGIDVSVLHVPPEEKESETCD